MNRKVSVAVPNFRKKLYMVLGLHAGLAYDPSSSSSRLLYITRTTSWLLCPSQLLSGGIQHAAAIN